MKCLFGLTRLMASVLVAMLVFGSLHATAATPSKSSVDRGCRADPSGGQRCIARVVAEISSPTPQNGKQLAATPVIVMPSKKTLFSGWVEYNTTTCALISSGSWTVTAAPTKGSVTAELLTSGLSGGACPGFTYPFAVIYYTWTSVNPADKTDAFSARWDSPDFYSEEDYSITVANVAVQAVDLNAGTLRAVLTAPTGLKGPVDMTFSGGGATSAPTPTTTEYGPGTITIPIDRPKIRPGNFTQLKLGWTVDGTKLTGTFDSASWNVLGIIRYSQYNVPVESSCSAGTASVFIVDSVNTCNFTAGTLRPNFISQTQLNGTGTSQSYGLVKGANATGVRRYCKGKFPAGATLDNTFVQVSSVTGSCNRNLVAGSTTATAGGLCGVDEALVTNPGNANAGSKTSQDTCPACTGDFRGTDGHIDSFSSNTSCSAHDAADLGNFWTLQTP